MSGQPREATHFFDLPIQTGDQPAWDRFLTSYPDMAATNYLLAPRTAFISGYLCHLQADWLWVKGIFAPAFGPGCSWGTFRQRLYYHNVLRAYLDLQILPGLPMDVGTCLGQVLADDWLPFVEDHYLAEWRDMLSRQLVPGAAIQTVEVFSSRQGISAPEYYALLASEERMQNEVFEHLSLELVENYNNQVLAANVQLLSDYLAFSMHPGKVLAEGLVLKGVQL